MWSALNWIPTSVVIGFSATWFIIPRFKNIFIKRGICGKDLSKSYSNFKSDKIPQIPEAQGVISGCIFLILTIAWIPLIVADNEDIDDSFEPGGNLATPTNIQLLQLFAALLSICCMLLLGFADDVLDLKWRHKMFLPAIASLPILVVYKITSNRTEIVVPLMLRPWIGSTIELGLGYYFYMGMLAIFCTHAINIYAGINGIEVGQSVVIAISIAIFNYGNMNGVLGDYHKFSLYLLCPYIATTLPLLWHNWYPSKVFPGDTFCYFSGMTFAVVAILGHFSKTLLLFFIPQVINFAYSIPQLSKCLPCPRHRLPKYNENTDTMEMSLAKVKASEMNRIVKMALYASRRGKLVHVKEYETDDGAIIEFNNLTIINLALKLFGPLHERSLTCILLGFQILCSCVAFFIRYQLALWFYGQNVL